MKGIKTTIIMLCISLIIPIVAYASVSVNDGALRYNGGQTSSKVYSEIWDNKTSFKGTAEDDKNYIVLATVKVGSNKHTSGWRIGRAYKEASRKWYANETSHYDYSRWYGTYSNKNWGKAN